MHEPSSINLNPPPYVQFEPSQGKIKRLSSIELRCVWRQMDYNFYTFLKDISMLNRGKGIQN